MAFIVLGCRTELEYGEAGVSVSIPKESYLADGYSEIPITVELLADEIEDSNRSVKLETKAGTFRTSTGESNEMTIELRPRTPNTVMLVLGTTPGEFVVKASLVSHPQYSSSETIMLDVIRANNLISLTLDTMRLDADGHSTIHGDIQLNNTLVRTVTVESTDAAGRFAGFESDPITLQADKNGKTSFDLHAGNIPGDYFIHIKLGDDRNFVYTEKYTLIALSSEYVVALIFDPSTGLRADGETVINGTVTFKDSPTQVAVLSTTGGKFISPQEVEQVELQLEPDSTAEFEYRMGNTVPDGGTGIQYNVSAAVKGGQYSVMKKLDILPAYPDRISVQPSSYEINADNGAIDIDVKLMRAIGLVSNGIEISFRAYQTQGANEVEVGRFTESIPAYSRSQGVRVTFKTDTRKPDTSKPIVIKATSRNDTNQPVTELIELTAEP